MFSAHTHTLTQAIITQYDRCANLIVVIIHNIYEYQIMTLCALNLHNMSIISPEIWGGGNNLIDLQKKSPKEETKQYTKSLLDRLMQPLGTRHPLFPGSVQKSEPLSTAMDP